MLEDFLGFSASGYGDSSADSGLFENGSGFLFTGTSRAV
jgi:hypothetical protein